MTLVETNSCPQFDVLHCSGVLYRIPDPMRLVAALRKITQDYLVLCSAVTATKVESDDGTLPVPDTAALFIPALQNRNARFCRLPGGGSSVAKRWASLRHNRLGNR